MDKKIYHHPLFFLGLLIRCGCIYIVAPLAVVEWFAPFLSNSITTITIDPWTNWVLHDGTLLAFPYGYAMWMTFLPLTILAKLIGVPSHFAYAFTLLLIDFALLLTLCKLWRNHNFLILCAYWLSPIIIFSTYIAGLNDIVPIYLLVLCFFYIREINFRLAGFFLISAISAKLSMVIALPFFIIYFIKNKALRKFKNQFFIGFILGVILLIVPFIGSKDGIKMIIENPEIDKLYRVSVVIGNQLVIYIIPLVYLAVTYFLWRIKRLNFDLFLSAIGITFLLIVLISPASPGWFVWSIPFLVMYQIHSGVTAIVLVAFFSFLYILIALLAAPIQLSNGLNFDLNNMLIVFGSLDGHIASLMYTLMMGLGLVITMRVWREAINQNRFYRLSQKPFVIGVAGDSGVGKDTFVDSLERLFGDHSVVKLSGDDYHLWDRQKPIWQVLTHLNPMANDLERFSRDLISLIDGKKIFTKHYDHQSGKIGKAFKLKSNDVIIASGLHALTMPLLRECFNLSIYIDMDDSLRRFFKIKRDVYVRGHSLDQVLASFAKRELDSQKFIHPQSEFADLVFSLHPAHPKMLEDGSGLKKIYLKLVVKSRHGFNEMNLNRVLVAVCGLHVDLQLDNAGNEVLMSIEGETSAEDVAIAADILCPNMKEFLDMPAGWKDGVSGLMQLIALSHIDQVLTRRFI